MPHDVYGLAWQSVGDDGHRVVGEVLFGVGVEVGATTSTAPPASPLARMLDWLGVAGRIGWYLAVAALAGIVVMGRSRSAVARSVTATWAIRAMVVLAAVTLLRGATAALVLAQAGAADTIIGSRGVLGWVGTAAVVGGLVLAQRRAGRPRGPLAPDVVALAVAVVGGALSGHALSRPDPVLAVTFSATHVAGAALWVGPLLVLLALVGRPAWTDLAPEDRRGELGAVMGAIGRVAGWSLGVVAASGALLGLRVWDGLGGGVLVALLVKLAVVAGVAVPLGIWHHRTREGWARVPRTVRAEAAGLVLALALGGVLVGWDPGWNGSASLDPAVAAVLEGSNDDPGLCATLDVGKAACYRSTFSTIIATQGPQAAIDAAVAAQASDPYVADNCHQVVHDVGNDAAEQIDSMAEALSVEGSACWSGYYHGFIEARLATVDDTELAATLPTFCDDAADPPYSFTHYNCLHGLGHGLMLRVDADLFAALPLCRELEEFWDLRSCASGAFMENVLAAQQGLDVPGVGTADLRFPCPEVDDDLKEDCYLMQTSTMVWRLDGDVGAAFGWCDRVEDPHRATCYRSMGRDISSISALDPGGVIERCGLGHPEFAAWCIDGAASNAVYEQAGADAADALCAAVPEEWVEACTTARDQALETVARG